MDANELFEHEIIKKALKMSVMNNVYLSHDQKQLIIDDIERAAQHADWIINTAKQFGCFR